MAGRRSEGLSPFDPSLACAPAPRRIKESSSDGGSIPQEASRVNPNLGRDPTPHLFSAARGEFLEDSSEMPGIFL